ncbi:MAG: EAL domain-containing protein [Gammaproteobacteria bacterium]|nr:MAG: EAL domain-containing protein [Gammaproteobacteria bacterium]
MESHRVGQDDGGRLSQSPILFLGTEHRHYSRVLEMLNARASSYRVQWCQSLSLGLDVLARRRFAAVLWDSRLAEDGLVDSLRMVVTQVDAPVIVLLEDDAHATVQHCLMAGAQDVLSWREMTPDLLHRTLDRACGRYAALRDRRFREGIDSLTGISDRESFYEHVAQAIRRAERDGLSLGVIYLNIDDFRRVNQSLGFRAGDQLIRMVAGRLRDTLRGCDAVARMGGDEFALLVDNANELYNVIEVMRKLRRAFSKPFLLGQRSVTVRLSMGAAVWPTSGQSVDELLRHAQTAMHEAKLDEGAGFRFFSDTANQEVQYRLELEADFRQALRGNKLVLYYQPQVDLESGDIVGMEALIRWPHPEHGLLFPGDFLELAERSGMIVPMGYWVLQRALQDMQHIREAGFGDLHCAINLSFRQFQDPKFIETTIRLLLASEVPTHCIEFELTESAMMTDRQHTRQCMEQLADVGVRFALDDFGTGYSSLNYLRKLPVSTIKVDRSFVEAVPEDEDDCALVRSMIDMAHSLRLHVVAEGVERPAQREVLRRWGCDYGQGYLFSRAVPLDELLEQLASAQQATGTDSGHG